MISFKKACEAHGLPFSDKPIDGSSGFGPTESNIVDGKRVGAYRTYLVPAMKRENLKVIQKAQASRVIFDGTKATGVEYLNKEGEKVVVNCNKEVILSCGTVRSPHVLLLSGVGDEKNLKKHNIPLVADVPGVGMNFQDHIWAAVFYEPSEPLPSFPGQFLSTQGLWRIDGNTEKQPDYQIVTIGRKEYLHNFPKPPGYEDKEVFMAASTLLHPRSSGSVSLSSSDPSAYPVVDPNYLACPEDLLVLRKGLELTCKIVSSMDCIKSNIIPGPLDVDDYIRGSAQSLFHPVGTCKMGNDIFAVVNEKFEVKGTQNLRVIDASVLPSLPSGNTHVPTLSVATRALQIMRGN